MPETSILGAHLVGPDCLSSALFESQELPAQRQGGRAKPIRQKAKMTDAHEDL